ncbi:MAG: transglycosylase family protein [Solirubrobacterales bacterium]
METGTDTPPASTGREPAPALASLRWAGLAGVLAVAALVALTASGAADAQTIDELQGRIAAAESDASGLSSSIDSGNAQLAVARSRADAAAEREAQLASVLANGEEREAELNAEVDAAAQRLATARARLDRALDALGSRLVAIYKGQTIDETQLLLDADGYDDLATRAQLLRTIQEADQELATRVRELRAAVAKRLEEVSAARDKQAAHNDQIAAARDQIAAARAAAEAQAAQIESLRHEQAAALEALRSQISGWSGQVQQAEAEAAAAAAAAAAATTQPTGSGPWAIPAGIVMCESGGNYGAVNSSSGAGGAYQILPSTWALYGGHGLPQNGSPSEQDDIAAQIWADSGSSAWVC